MSFSLSRSAKSAYVSGMRTVGWIAARTGALDGPLPSPRQNRMAHWRRSLLAIHDIDSLVALDVPWWTYDAIAAVEDFLAGRPGARVFEYGSGASTIWLARRAASVTSVEHDQGWFGIVRQRLDLAASLAPVDLSLVPPDRDPPDEPLYRSQKPGAKALGFRAYARAIDAQPGAFDLIIVDGRARSACLRHAERKLAPGGMVVFDNSSRARYRPALKESPLSAQRLAGLAPCLPYPDETTLLRDGGDGRS